MILPIIWASAVLGYLMARVAEIRIHRRNYRTLQRAGADERAIWLMRVYYALPLLLIPAAIFEQLQLATPTGRSQVVLGLMLVLAGQILRLWAISTLGPLWTMRCLAIAGVRHTRLGPYRVLENPEYISRLIDGLGFTIMFGAWISAAVYVTLTLALQRRLVATERLQADELIFVRPSASVSALEPQTGGQIA